MSKHCVTLLLAALTQVAGLSAQVPAGAESYPQIRGVPPVVQRVARSLWIRTHMHMNGGSPSFYAIGVRAQDTARIMKEFQPRHRVRPLTAQALADALRHALRQEFARETAAVGIIIDSVAAAVADSMGEAKRFAISEINTFDGLCVRIITPYHLIKREERPGFNRMVYGEPVLNTCEWQNYWAHFTDAAAKLAAARARPAPLATPIVKPFRFSAEKIDSATTGRFAGTLTIYDDSLVVVFSELVISSAPRATLDLTKIESVSVGVGGEFNGEWSLLDDSAPLVIGQSWRAGSQLSRPKTRFVIRRQRTHEDKDYWLVVMFKGLARSPFDPAKTVRASFSARSASGLLDVR